MANRLSKSKFQTGLQCPKALWLSTHARDLADPTPDTQQHIFDTGTSVGELARDRFAGGVLVAEDYTESAQALETTRRLLEDPPSAIFEAALDARRCLRAPRRARACRREPLGSLRGQVGNQGQAGQHHRRRGPDLGARRRRPPYPPRPPDASRQHLRLRGRRLRPRTSLPRRGRHRRGPCLHPDRPGAGRRDARHARRRRATRGPHRQALRQALHLLVLRPLPRLPPQPSSHRTAADQRVAAGFSRRGRHLRHRGRAARLPRAHRRPARHLRARAIG